MFKPSFCSNPTCRYHKRSRKKGTWYKHSGSYKTQAFGNVKRYQCLACGKTFSEQTFKIDYYAKKIVDYKFLFQMLTSAAGIRDMARLMNKFFTRRFVSTLDNITGEEHKIWFRGYKTPLKANPEYHQRTASCMKLHNVLQQQQGSRHFILN